MNLETSDIIEIFSTLINSGLAVWIVVTLQNSINNRRILKDHFINEIKELKNDYTSQINLIYSGNSKPKELTPWFKFMNIKSTNLLSILNKKYKINSRFLSSYQIDLRDIVTEFDEFKYNFSKNELIILGEDSKNILMKFQQQSIVVFNNLIIEINDK